MIHDEIDEYLDRLARDNAYRVTSVLKESAYEVTERVAFVGAGGVERGPFVRKRIKRDAGVGGAYRELFAAQRRGRRFVHLPRIEDCYELGDELVVVMEHVEGPTLHEVVYERDPSLGLAREVFPALCEAAAELHEGFEAPIVHRDLKPTNVIVSEANLTLIDLGIARAWRDELEADTNAFGTRAYAPPEQFGFGQTSVRSDVYALGMLLYYLLCEEVPSPALAGSGFKDDRVPEPLRNVLSKATAFDPAARYGSTRELKAAFLAAAEEAAAEQKAREAAKAASARAVSQPQAGPPIRVREARPPSADHGTAIAACSAAPPHRMQPKAAVGAGHSVARSLQALYDKARENAWVRVTEWLGLAWDALLLLCAGILVAVSAKSAMGSQEGLGAAPQWTYAMMYALITLFLLSVGGLLVDWRWLKRHVGPLKGFRWSYWLLAAGIAAVASFVAAVVVAAIAAAIFPK